MSRREGHFKDEVLDTLAKDANVAQFVSYAPGEVPTQRFARVRGFPPNHPFDQAEDAVSALIGSSSSHSVNVRSFDPFQPQANEFVYGLTDPEDARAALIRLATGGLYTIVNETIDIEDGGVSGVLLDEVVEFAPEDTPRAVEKPDVASLPTHLGLQILETVYGFGPDIPKPGTRIEFSLHPLRTGYRMEHIVTWESEEVDRATVAPRVSWPNRFSRFVGDKAFGLLVAALSGALVPESLVIPRRLAPFRFGKPTGTDEVWTRTCPPEPVPGRFTTIRGYADPFALLQREDSMGDEIASVLIQSGVAAEYSGATATQEDGSPIIEGVSGMGVGFMQGDEAPQHLPESVELDLRALHREMSSRLGPVNFEWVHDGGRVWVLQLHVGSSASTGRTIYPGHPVVEHRFDVHGGLERLRSLVEHLEGTGEGVVLMGSVGITSHFGDVLRRARVPSRIEPPATSQ